MKIKKIFSVALIVMCAMVMTSTFIGCGKDDDGNDVKTYVYRLTFDVNESIYYFTDLDLETGLTIDNYVGNWMNSVMAPYHAALGSTTGTFSRTGRQAECDKQVFDACKVAEETAKDIRGGAGTVMVVNATAGDRVVYRYNVQR